MKTDTAFVIAIIAGPVITFILILILILANPGCSPTEPQPDGSPAATTALSRPSQTGSSPAGSSPSSQQQPNSFHIVQSNLSLPFGTPIAGLGKSTGAIAYAGLAKPESKLQALPQHAKLVRWNNDHTAGTTTDLEALR